MSDKETICRVAFVNNNPDDKVFQPYPSGDYTAIKTAELTDIKRQLKDWQCLNDSNSRLNAYFERRLAEAQKLVEATSRDCNATALERNKLRAQLAKMEEELAEAKFEIKNVHC